MTNLMSNEIFYDQGRAGFSTPEIAGSEYNISHENLKDIPIPLNDASITPKDTTISLSICNNNDNNGQYILPSISTYDLGEADQTNCLPDSHLSGDDYEQMKPISNKNIVSGLPCYLFFETDQDTRKYETTPRNHRPSTDFLSDSHEVFLSTSSLTATFKATANTMTSSTADPKATNAPNSLLLTSDIQTSRAVTEHQEGNILTPAFKPDAIVDTSPLKKSSSWIRLLSKRNIKRNNKVSSTGSFPISSAAKYSTYSTSSVSSTSSKENSTTVSKFTSLAKRNRSISFPERPNNERNDNNEQHIYHRHLTSDINSSPKGKSFFARMLKLTRNNTMPLLSTGSDSTRHGGNSGNTFSFPAIALIRSNSDKSETTSISRLDNTRSISKSNVQSVIEQHSASVDAVVSAIHSGNFLKLTDVNVDQSIRSLSGKNSNVLETVKIKSAAVSTTDARLISKLIKSSDAANIKVLRLDRNAVSQDAFKHLFEAFKVNKTIRELSITRSGFNDKTIKYLAKALLKNTSLKELDLSFNRITAQGFEALCESLLSNRVLTRLCVQSNDIKTAGARHLAELLEKNFVIQHVNIGSNGLGSDGCIFIANSLRFNRSLTSLSLDLNEMGARGASAMAVALSNNQVLTHLYIPHNNINDEGLVEISASLKRNRSLIVLDLELNSLGSGQNTAGLKALGEAIRVNSTLRELNLSYNLFSSEAVQELMKGVEANATLESILFTNCCMTTEGAMAVAGTLPLATGMQNIGLTQNPDISVEAYWALAQNLEKNRSMKGIQLDYNSEDRHVLYESIQRSLTRNFLWQQAVYRSTCRILTLSRIVLFGRSMEQKLPLAYLQQSSGSGWNILKRIGLGRTSSSTSQNSLASFKKFQHVDSATSNRADGGGDDPMDGFEGVPNLPHGSNSSKPPSIYESQGNEGSLSRLNSFTHIPKSTPYQNRQARKPELTSLKSYRAQTPHMSSTQSFPSDYNAHNVMAHIANMPHEIFEAICAFLDSEGNMSIAQIRDTIKIGGNRSTLSPHFTKASMLEQIHHSRYIPSVGVRYNIKNGDERI